ncbi:acyl-CoA thioesterase [Amycolatopsis thermophila]|uniref:Acyl-CoA thioesterase-2 n=1 Tax=Amycolatopsis thermophila TaxID=206084 RepID=A0ABU0F1U6_9PSEU|nr:acyl-CoA thioesterase domain-containing protein [Amycolatopsis thermophila]MDQ0381368.1 acyl-CoA thioesterase-2 [Amycolatopsis thermophila]
MSALRHFLDRLDLDPLAPGVFGDPGGEEGLERIFGGQVAAQALAAMGRTVDADKAVHHLHVEFVRPPRASAPLRLEVGVVKDGRAFALRRVEAAQGGVPVLTATASFHRAEAGPVRLPAGEPPEPIAPRWEDRFAGRRHRLSPLWDRPRPIDFRYLDPAPLDDTLRQHPRDGQSAVLRADGALPDDPLIHACTAVYASDMTLLETALLPLGEVWADGDTDGASLNHTMWFHRPFRMDRWVRYDQRAEALAGGRGLASGRMFDDSGELVATVLQEGSLRPAHGAGTWLARSAPDRTLRRAT